MKQAVRLGCLLAMLLAPLCRADVASDIEAVCKDKLLQKATVGVEVIRLGKSATDSPEVYQRHARMPLTPASNLKLTTTSAALDRFGPAFKFRTLLLEHDGDLILVGDGDPSFGDAEYLKRVGWTPTTVFEDWTARLKKLGVKSVKNILVDDSIFDDEFLHPHWPINQIDHWYVAEVGGMDFDVNCVKIIIEPKGPGARVGYTFAPPTHYLTIENTCITGRNGVQLGRKPGTNYIVMKGEAPSGADSSLQETIHDPPMYAATVLAETLAAGGISVTGKVQRDRDAMRQRQSATGADAAHWKTVGVNETALAVALQRANKDSMNLYAECLCKLLGHETAHAAGSWENGTAAVAAFLKRIGVPQDEFHLDDGSGLSKQNHISPHALARVLTYDFFSPNRDAFLSSLAIAGVDGTLTERFRGTDLRRRVIGKSGFVEGVSCLTGLLKARDGQWYVFSIMMNGIPYKSNSLAKSLQEKIVRALDVNAGTLAAR